MAVKVGGTTVINDSRGLENVTNLKTVNGQSILGTGDVSIPAYAHPANHPASVITQDASNRFVTDVEKAAWNAKQPAGTYATGTGTASGTNTGDQTTITGNAGSATTLSTGADRTKLDGIAAGANNFTYAHPANHPASIIAQDASNRFVTDAEKAAWNAKSEATHTHAAATTTVAGFMSDVDKVKLDGISAGATAYVHPANHPASIIAQDASNRFVTDTEKAAWNGAGADATSKASAAQAAAIAASTPSAHAGATGAAHGVATTTVAGFISAADKTKLDGIVIGPNGISGNKISGTGMDNTAFGNGAMLTAGNTTGSENAAFGKGAMGGNRNGLRNTASGAYALNYNSAGNHNTACGYAALRDCGGSYNIGIGSSLLASGSYSPVFDVLGESNRVVMGNSAVTNAYIKVAWTVVSDARDKTNFADIPHGLDFVKQLKPTAYQFKESRESEETNGGVRYGFKAQDIAAIEPEAVIVDTTNPEKLYYNESNLVPVLVKAIQELTAKNDALEARLAALERRVV